MYSTPIQSLQCQRVLEKSGVEYTMHGYGTNIEGPVSPPGPDVTQSDLSLDLLVLQCSGPRLLKSSTTVM
jgi:hypothetical protein